MDRVTEHIIKAAREAKVDTSWLRPDEDYEAGLRQMVQSVYGDPEMVEDIAAVAAALGEHGRRNSLVRTTWRLTAPGVPDLYRGCEDWDFSLTDPDNRRPVDLARLAAALNDDQMTDKHKWTRALLDLRRRHRDAFSAGAPYRPLAAKGGGRDLVVAYMRGDTVAVITSSRPNADLTDTCLELPDGTWRDLPGERSHAGGWLDVEDLLVCAPGGVVLTRVA
jgi:(1->4)-alpha-D-glucan 1-alpha-D-glucosylmutase